ncbi:MAG: DUF1232 domain-containing protein [Myxococcales bacterium]|nr:DUF1232 domain-containing protein [Myxococcales bacterium]
MSFEPPSYLTALREFVDGYAGTCARSILRAGDVFAFYSRLFSDERLDREARGLACAALAYFVVPRDLLPEEELGPYGLIDDLFVAAHVFRLLRRVAPPDALADAWIEPDSLDDVMTTIYAETRAALGRRARKALRMAGVA